MAKLMVKDSPIGKHYHLCAECDGLFVAHTTKTPYSPEFGDFSATPTEDSPDPIFCGCDGSIGLEYDKVCEDCEVELQRQARWESYDTDRDFDIDFADPYGDSALRAETGGSKGYCPSCKGKVGRRANFCQHCGYALNPRIHPCPTCGAKDVLTTEDVQLHYQCDRCANRAEGKYGYWDY